MVAMSSLSLLRLALGLAAVTSSCGGAQEVEVLLHGATSGLWQTPKIEAGKKIIVECKGQWRQKVEVKAFFTGPHETELSSSVDSSNWWDTEEADSASHQFEFSPSVTDRGHNTRVGCRVHEASDSIIFEGDLLAEDFTDVSIVFPPQPGEDVYVAVTTLGQLAEATLEVVALPAPGREEVVWETAGNLLQKVTESSPVPGYSLTVREVEDGVTRIHLVIARVTAEDLGIHTVTVRSELGTQTYKVRFYQPESARVWAAPLPSQVQPGGGDSVQCRSEGGNPPPRLEARLEVRGRAVRDLLVLEEGGRGGHREATFLLDPRVAERSEGETFVVCEAVQAVGGQAVYEDVVARAGVDIVYPPQPQEEQYVYASLEEPASVTLVVEAFPRPLRREVVWREELGGYYRMEVSFPSPSSVRVDVTVAHVREHEYGIRHSIRVENELGQQLYYFQVVKPTPVWVWVLVGLGVVGALGLLLVVLFFYPGLLVRKTGGQGRRGQGENQETGAAFLAESAT